MIIHQLTSLAEIGKLLQSTGTSLAGIPLMASKAIGIVVDIGEHDCSIGNIIKQEALAVGADAAVHEQTSRCGVGQTKIILVGTLKQLKILAKKLQKNVTVLPKIGQQLEKTLQKKFKN